MPESNKPLSLLTKSVLCDLKKSSMRERWKVKTRQMKGVTISYHSCTKWTHALIIDAGALSQHFIVSYMSQGMTRSRERTRVVQSVTLTLIFQLTQS